jgi:hypothetical protein
MGTVKRNWNDSMSHHSELDADIRALGTTPQEVVEGAGPCGKCQGKRTITGIAPESGFDRTVVRVALWCRACKLASHCLVRHKLEVEAEEEARMPMGRIIETRVTRSLLKEAAVKTAARCPECGGQDNLQVEFNSIRATMPKETEQTIWDVCCPCGCEFVVVWEDDDGKRTTETDAEG